MDTLPFADFLHTGLQLFSLEKDDEHRFVYLIARYGILETLLDLGLSQEHVASADSPQHALEGRQSITQNDAGDESRWLA